MVARHSATIRGIETAGHDRDFTGRFGRLFPDLEAAAFGSTPTEADRNLHKLADLMISDFDPPKDGPDD